MHPLPSDHATVPAEDRLRRAGRRVATEQLATEGPGPRRELAALMVGESQASTATLQPENSVLFQDVVERSLLVLVQPTGEGRKQNVEVDPRFSHRVRSL